MSQFPQLTIENTRNTTSCGNRITRFAIYPTPSDPQYHLETITVIIKLLEALLPLYNGALKPSDGTERKAHPIPNRPEKDKKSLCTEEMPLSRSRSFPRENAASRTELEDAWTGWQMRCGLRARGGRALPSGSQPLTQTRLASKQYPDWILHN